MFCSKIDMFASVFIRLLSRYESLVKTKQKTKNPENWLYKIQKIHIVN